MAQTITKFVEIPYIGSRRWEHGIHPRGIEFLEHFGSVNFFGTLASFTINDGAYADAKSCLKMLEAALNYREIWE